MTDTPPEGSKLDTILKQAFNTAWTETQPTGKWIARDYDPDFPLTLPPTKAEIKSLLLELVGDLESIRKGMSMTEIHDISTRNTFRDELRKEIEKL